MYLEAFYEFLSLFIDSHLLQYVVEFERQTKDESEAQKAIEARKNSSTQNKPASEISLAEV
jgi:hypothetical protein